MEYMELIKIIKERDENDDGTRYTSEDVIALRNAIKIIKSYGYTAFNKSDINLLKECLPDLIKRYEETKSVYYDHEKKELKTINKKINGIKKILKIL